MTTFEQQQLAQRVYEQITNHPETHDQTEWIYTEAECGTAACVAGWAIMLSPLTNYHVTSDGIPEFDTLGGYGTYSTTAAYVLGLDPLESERLFRASLKPEAAVEAVKYLANGKKIDWLKIKADCDGLLIDNEHYDDRIYTREDGTNGV